MRPSVELPTGRRVRGEPGSAEFAEFSRKREPGNAVCLKSDLANLGEDDNDSRIDF